ncbi:hypothetical protein, partial [Aphanizomenon flos-aquae]|uniref:hypothetical protein n=1 Tax=Aphanizomenon flos-aquae TaxID=1176 RepID=UPI00190F1DE7
MNWSKGIEILRQNSIQRQLLFQGVVLTIITPTLICFCLQELGLRVDWVGVAFGVPVSVAVGVAVGVAGDVAYGVLCGVAFGVAFRCGVRCG